MKRIKAAIKRLIISAVIEDYRNNGRMRRLINDGLAQDLAHDKEPGLLFRIQSGEV
jgi:hypothetical protein